MKTKSLLSCLILVCLLTSCASNQLVQEKTVYADIPTTYQTLPDMPDIPPLDVDEVTVAEVVDLANALRLDSCLMRSRYRELYRFATFDAVVLPEPTEMECPR